MYMLWVQHYLWSPGNCWWCQSVWLAGLSAGLWCIDVICHISLHSCNTSRHSPTQPIAPITPAAAQHCRTLITALIRPGWVSRTLRFPIPVFWALLCNVIIQHHVTSWHYRIHQTFSVRWNSSDFVSLHFLLNTHSHC